MYFVNLNCEGDYLRTVTVGKNTKSKLNRIFKSVLLFPWPIISIKVAKNYFSPQQPATLADLHNVLPKIISITYKHTKLYKSKINMRDRKEYLFHLCNTKKRPNAVHPCNKFLVYVQCMFALLLVHVKKFLCSHK